MNRNVRVWALIAVAAVCAGGAAFWWHRSQPLSTAELLQRMPAKDALVFYIDFDRLRRGGYLQLLDGSKAGEDEEYQAFVKKTAFDYKRDLDSALVAFAPTGKFLLLRGRFDWKTLRSYVEGQQGHCADSLCRIVGSQPDRRISFFPLRSGLMAMAVSSDDSAATRLANSVSGPEPQVPDAPVWLSLPPASLKSPEGLPDGTRPFVRSISNADAVTISFTPEGQNLAGKLNVLCRNEIDAVNVSEQLTKITGMLRDMIAREHQTPNPADWSGVLTSGTFKADRRRVYGYWLIQRSFVQFMLGAQ